MTAWMSALAACCIQHMRTAATANFEAKQIERQRHIEFISHIYTEFGSRMYTQRWCCCRCCVLFVFVFSSIFTNIWYCMWLCAPFSTSSIVTRRIQLHILIVSFLCALIRIPVPFLPVFALDRNRKIRRIKSHGMSINWHSVVSPFPRNFADDGKPKSTQQRISLTAPRRIRLWCVPAKAYLDRILLWFKQSDVMLPNGRDEVRFGF